MLKEMEFRKIYVVQSVSLNTNYSEALNEYIYKYGGVFIHI